MNEIQFLIYDEGGQTEVLVQDETLWATQKSIAELFSVSVPTINEHLKNIFESGELEQNPTIRKFRIVRQEAADRLRGKLNTTILMPLFPSATAYFDYVERLLEDKHLLGMQDFARSIDDFLSFNRYDILPHKGKISREQAAQRAVEVYQAYNKQQKITSDFDKAVKRIQGEKSGKK